MANNLKFYYSENELKNTSYKEGNIYFVLNKDKDEQNNNIASLFLDIEDGRYQVKPFLEEATVEQAGLLSATDKKKLVGLSVEPIALNSEDEGPAKINIEVNSGKNDKQINFSDYLYVKKDQVLTANSISKVSVNPLDSSANSSSAELLKDVDGKFHLKLNLLLPKGDKGDNAHIGTVTAKIDKSLPKYNADDFSEDILSSDSFINVPVNVSTEENTNITNFDFSFPPIIGPQGKEGKKGDKGDTGDVGPQGSQGPQGEAAQIEFQFHPTDAEHPYGDFERETIPPSNEDDSNSTVKYIYHVYIPRGEKGEPGRPFKIAREFVNYDKMKEALDNGELQYGDFILIYSDDNMTDKENGKLYYYSYNKNYKDDHENYTGLVFIEDTSPTQPVFSIDDKVVTLSSQETAKVEIVNPEEVTRPKLKFSIPRGKPLQLNGVTATVDTKVGSPTVETTVTSDENRDNDNYDTTIKFDFQNLGTRVIADATVDENIGTPSVDVTSTSLPEWSDPSNPEKKFPAQKLTFNFKNLKGKTGDAASPFAEVITTYISDTSKHPGPYATNRIEYNEAEEPILHLFFYNLEGKEGQSGSIESISKEGSGNAVSNININTENKELTVTFDNFITKNTFENTVFNVEHGGTGQTSLNQNEILVGNGTDGVRTISINQGGALYANQNSTPTYGILPVMYGGTGISSLTKNSLIIGDDTNNLKTIRNQNGVLIRDSSDQEAPYFVNPIPVKFGGTGKTTFDPYSVVVTNATGDYFETESYLSVSKGGTGTSGFTQNATLIGGTVNNGSQIIDEIPSSAGAFFSTGDNETPQFDVLPIKYGGTGSTNVEDTRYELGTLSGQLEDTYEDTGRSDDYRLKLEGIFI